MKLQTLNTNSRQAFAEHYAMWHQCVRCKIGECARHHVFSRGTVPCDVLFIGEAPGETEDLVGEPFVGRSGKRLNDWIRTASAEQAKEDPLTTVFAPTYDTLDEQPILFSFAVTNTVLCRPVDEIGKNRPPTGVETANCHPRLVEFIMKVAQPNVIVTLGKVAQHQTPIWAMPILNLLHPSYVLRCGGEGCRQDLEQKEKLCQFLKQHRSLFSSNRTTSSPGVSSKG